VFLAKCTRTGKLVVVKGGWVPFQGPLQAIREKEILSDPLANCPGVPRLLDAVDQQSWLLLVEEPYGTPLDDHVDFHPPDLRTLFAWAKQMISILGEVHARGVIHRDSKPSKSSSPMKVCVLLTLDWLARWMQNPACTSTRDLRAPRTGPQKTHFGPEMVLLSTIGSHCATRFIPWRLG